VTTPRGKHTKPSRAAAERNAPDAQFQQMYQENLGPIYRSVYSRVGNREDAEDLTSSIFLKAVEGVDYARPPRMIQRWLFQVARTTLADHWRKRYRFIAYSLEELQGYDEVEPSEEESCASNTTRADRLHQLLRARLSYPSLEEYLDEEREEPAEEYPEAGDKSATKRVQRLLQELPAHCREVLTCRFLLNLSIRDTARRMGLSEANVKVMQSRALKRAAELELIVNGC
jgi:RNA polymerase sigma-70 factor, ECF subfamily